MNIIDSEETTFHVVINHEEQYSLWPGLSGHPCGLA